MLFTVPVLLRLRWASVLLDSLSLQSQDHTRSRQSLQRATAGKTSFPSAPMTSNANTARECWKWILWFCCRSFSLLVHHEANTVTGFIAQSVKDSWKRKMRLSSFARSFRLHSHPPLSKEFEVSLKNLPSTYDHKNTSTFQQFISVYGTYHIRRVHLGGRIHSVEAAATIKGIATSRALWFCLGIGKSLKHGRTFSQAFHDRTTKVLGGDGDVGDLLFDSSSVAGYKKWLSSLKRVPGVVSDQVSPYICWWGTNWGQINLRSSLFLLSFVWFSYYPDNVHQESKV